MRHRRQQQLLPGAPDALGLTEDKAVVDKVAVLPEPAVLGHPPEHRRRRRGARHTKNQANAIKFLEYLANPEAQNYFANGNNEWPAAKGVELDNPALKAMTDGKPFQKSETIPIRGHWAPTPPRCCHRSRRFPLIRSGASLHRTRPGRVFHP